ncbi:MAG: 4Fe-4S cluster-binding domain-containing protein, partial [Clostridiales bacterium]|nr:4Fe-4S cluster-binding domain-containing protein [Clostridiales bacterium]
MEIRIFGTVEDSIVDGPGLRFSVFVQGCPHHCPGCHNPGSHDFDGGRLLDTQDI